MARISNLDGAYMDIRIERWSEDKLYASRGVWTELLRRSDADPLFLSWAWQASWWETWGKKLSLELYVLAAWRGNELVGLAPLYRDSFRFGPFGSLKRLQFLGNAWKRAPTVRTEYLDFIVVSDARDSVLMAFADYLQKDAAGWDELAICDYERTAKNFKIWQSLCHAKGLCVLESRVDTGIRIATNRPFSNWLASLGKNTRLKAYNRRRELNAFGCVVVEAVDSRSVESLFAFLNGFHVERWGKACFEGPSLDFHLAFLKRLDDNQQLKFSTISVDGKVISVLYDICAGGKEYNLQAGYVEQFDRKISLGTLHLGYAIESAFNDVNVESIDLLAGCGKNTFYKAHFSGETVEFVTLTVVSRKSLALAYKGYFLWLVPFVRRLREMFRKIE